MFTVYAYTRHGKTPEGRFKTLEAAQARVAELWARVDVLDVVMFPG